MSGTVVNPPAYRASWRGTLEDLDRVAKVPSRNPAYPADTRIYYPPETNVHDVLVALLGACQSSLELGMYGFADDELAALVAKHLDNPKIVCEVTLDKSQAAGVHERDILAKWKAEYESNSVAIGTSERGKIMHRKVLVIDGRWLVTGSTNWSDSGERLQDNQLSVHDDAVLAAEARTTLKREHVKALTQMGRVS